MEGFFNPEKNKPKKKSNTKRIVGCESCSAYKNCKNGKLGVQGLGDKGILIVGNPVTKREDRTGRAFSDMSSAYLRHELRNIGIDMERDCWMLNSVQCYSENVTSAMYQGCRRRMDATIRDLKPKKILLLGSDACDMFLGERIEKSRIGSGNAERWYGMSAPDQDYECWVHADYHPSFVVNSLVERKRLAKKYGWYRGKDDIPLWEHSQLIESDDFKIRSLYFKKYLKTILHNKQFIKENYKEYCSWIPTVEEAIALMRSMRKSPHIFMDYETNSLMSYKDNSKILCASLSDGTVSYSFPFFKDNIKFVRTFKSLFTNPDIKVGIANFSFEDQWTRSKLGFAITNCYWDTVLGAHVLAPTVSKNSNLKVNTYKICGVLGYDAEVEPYIKGKDEDDPFSLNRLEELDPKIVGMYNAEDSLYTGKITFHQMKEIEGNRRLNNIFRLYMRGQEMYSEMSFNGIPVDEEQLIRNEMELEERLVILTGELKRCGELKEWYNVHPDEEFNFNSNDQLKEFFYNILGLKAGKRTKSGDKSVDADVLEEFSKHSELAKILCEYKKVFKLKNTDLKNIRKFTHNGRIHPNVGLAVASTGRSNSASPNFQNMDGSELGLRMVRSCLMAEEGQEFGAYDFKSLEVYTGIGISKDEMKRKELEDPDEDSHTKMTQQFFGEDLETAGRFILKAKEGHDSHSKEDVKHFIKSEMRQLIKSANFALQYFGGANRVYITLFEESFKEYHKAWFDHKGYKTVDDRKGLCKKVYEYYWERYKTLRKYIEDTWQEYLKTGEVYSQFGWRINGIVGKTFISNFDSQGSGLVIALLANLKLWEIMKKKKYKSSMKLTVHDSTEFSLDPEEFFEGGLEQDIKYAMEDYVNKKVRWLELPLRATPEYYDRNWGLESEREVWEERFKESA